MMKKLIAIAALSLTAVPVLASDVTYDQRNAAALSQQKGSEARPTPCSCPCPNR